jgi:H+-translocating NAD(P) transhydrogenase subunit alpha
VKIRVPKESHPGEQRAALIPADVKRLLRLGAQISVQAGLGAGSWFSDADYTAAGATIVADAATLLQDAEIVLRVRKPSLDEVALLPAGCLQLSFLDPFREPQLIAALAKQQVSAVSLEMLPRSTLAQKMDTLSSQASLAGYVAVVLAAERCQKVLPMMMTPAGTLRPCSVFIIGAGVAGLQAIATAKRLGARVEAYDTRPVVEEQVRSLGARFLKIELGETGQTKDGYAKALSEEQLQHQRDAMAKACANSDIVITTAQVFGKPAPRLLNAAMLAGMHPGSIVVDMAVESGGNVEGSKVDEEVLINGVRILGIGNLPGKVATHASQMFSSNLCYFLEHFWDKSTKRFVLDPANDLIKACLITHQGSMVNERLAAATSKA